MREKQTAQLKHDWALKLLALVCAIVLWFYADAEQNPYIVKHFDIPVQYVNQAEDLVVVGGVQTVRVTTRGKETDLSSLRSDDFTATIDLTDALVGSNVYPVQVEVPNLVERYSCVPDKLTLIIDQRQTKVVPVHVRTTGTVPSGYRLESTEVVPDTVTIAGLSQILDNVTGVETETIELSDMTGEVRKEVLLSPIEGVSVQGSSRVTVQFQVQEEQAYSNYEGKIEVSHVPNDMEVTLEQQTATVQVSGSAALLDNRQELNRIQFYVDCSNVQEGQTELPVQVRYSGSLVIGEVTPATVLVTAVSTVPVGTEEEANNHTNNNDEGDLN